MDKLLTQRTISIFGYDDVITFEIETLDSAIVDVFDDDGTYYAIYDYDLMLKSLVEYEGIDIYEATDVIEDILMLDGPIVLIDK